MHGPVRVPEAVGIGSAKVVVSFDDWKEGRVASSEQQLAVVAAPAWAKWQPESARLRRTLVHPEQAGMLQGLLFSPDGRRLVAGHARGVIQVWDVASGKQLTEIDNRRPPAPNQDHFFAVSPDWHTLYVGYRSLKLWTVPREKKPVMRFEPSGNVQAWDVETGQPRKGFAPVPSPGTEFMNLAPDGSLLLTIQRPAGDHEKWPPALPTLWNAQTGQRLASLPPGAASAAFAPDGKTLLLSATDEAAERANLLFCAAANGKTLRSVPLPKKGDMLYERTFTPDGKYAIGNVFNRNSREESLTFWDAETGQELGSLGVDQQYHIDTLVCSPDGRKLAASVLPFNRQGAGKLYLIDLASRKLVKKWTLDADCLPVQGRTHVGMPAFSPDGKWLAVASQAIPPKQPSLRGIRVDNLGQPHIHLIEAATGAVPEMLASPPGYAAGLCFSPDGKTLASSGDGRVLLWDMTAPPRQRK